MNKRDLRIFFQFVLPSVLSFALSGVYAIVDGFFIGNSIGDAGLSAVNIAYPIVAVIQAIGTGIGMGGAIYYSINTAEKQEKRARKFTAGTLWVLILSSILFTFLIFVLNRPLLSLLGAGGEILSLGEEYIAIIALGAALQIIGTGLIPFIRNHGGSFYAMIAMIAGFLTNMLLDYVFVWELEQGVAGAAIATIIGQGVTMLIALVYLLRKKQFTLHIAFSKLGRTAADIIKVGIAPFGLAMSPNISLFIINRFSYGGEKAIATYACIAYIICIIFMLVLMLILPPLFGGQIMIWWSTVNARILSALLALLLKQRVDKEDLYKGGELA